MIKIFVFVSYIIVGTIATCDLFGKCDGIFNAKINIVPSEEFYFYPLDYIPKSTHNAYYKATLSSIFTIKITYINDPVQKPPSYGSLFYFDYYTNNLDHNYNVIIRTTSSVNNTITFSGNEQGSVAFIISLILLGIMAVCGMVAIIYMYYIRIRNKYTKL
jgi:hypothetical protein